jgi:hypothetical protein
MKLERKIEPSRLRRGRWATAPVWYVTTEAGNVWRFGLKRNAETFRGRFGVCALLGDPGAELAALENAKSAHAGDGSVCWACEGSMVERAGVRL